MQAAINCDVEPTVKIYPHFIINTCKHRMIHFAIEPIEGIDAYRKCMPAAINYDVEPKHTRLTKGKIPAVY